MDSPVSRVIIHVGPPKTGTSAVQHVLRHQDNSAVFYPKIGQWADGAHHNLIFNFYQDFRRPEILREDAEAMLAGIEAELGASGRNLVISSESLVNYDIAPFIQALLGHLGAQPEQVEILCVCRAHLDRAASLYNQAVKDFVSAERAAPSAYLLRQPRMFTYAQLIRRLRASGFAVRVLNYHPAETFLPRFLDHIGYVTDQPVANENRNVSLSVKRMIATLAVNNLAQSAEERATCVAALRGLRKSFARSDFIFDDESVAAVADIFAEDCAFLARDCGIVLPQHQAGTRACALHLGPEDIADITKCCATLGPVGEKIVAFAQSYLRADS